MNSKIYQTMLMYAMAGLMLNDTSHLDRSTAKTYEDLTDEEKQNIKRYYEARKKELLFKKGLKEFCFGGITIIALNEKNAKRKYEKFVNQKPA